MQSSKLTFTQALCVSQQTKTTKGFSKVQQNKTLPNPGQEPPICYGHLAQQQPNKGGVHTELKTNGRLIEIRGLPAQQPVWGEGLGHTATSLGEGESTATSPGERKRAKSKAASVPLAFTSLPFIQLPPLRSNDPQVCL